MFFFETNLNPKKRGTYMSGTAAACFHEYQVTVISLTEALEKLEWLVIVTDSKGAFYIGEVDPSSYDKALLLKNFSLLDQDTRDSVLSNEAGDPMDHLSEQGVEIFLPEKISEIHLIDLTPKCII